MRLATGQLKTPSNKPGARAAFTLVELVVVMTIMVVVVGVVAPSLKGFLQGRNLNNETQRFLSLTHYGLERAVSEGVPVVLWMNPRKGTYGLAANGGYTETQTNAVNFTLDKDLKMTVSQPPGTLTQSNFWTPTTQQHGGAMPTIRFQPDGFISDNSPQRITLRQGTGPEVWIVENPNHTQYDIQLNHPGSARF